MRADAIAASFKRARHEQGAAIVAQRAARVEQREAVRQVGKGVVTEFRHVDGAGESAPVEGLHILHKHLEINTFRVHFTVQHRVENEGVVGTGRKAECEFCHFGHCVILVIAAFVLINF